MRRTYDRKGKYRRGRRHAACGGSAGSWSPTPSARSSASASPAPASSTPPASSSPPPTSAGPTCRSAADLGQRVRPARRRRQRRQRRGPRRADVRRGAGQQPHLRPRRRGRRRRARARRAALRRLVVRRRRDRPRRRRARRRPLRVRQAGLPGDRGVGAVARPSRSRPAAGDGAAVLARAGEHLGIALATVLSAARRRRRRAVGLRRRRPTETFRAAAAGAIAARTMPRARRPPRRAGQHVRLRRRPRRRSGPRPRSRARHPMTTADQILPPSDLTRPGDRAGPRPNQPRPRRTPVNRTRSVRTLAVLATAEPARRRLRRRRRRIDDATTAAAGGATDRRRPPRRRPAGRCRHDGWVGRRRDHPPVAERHRHARRGRRVRDRRVQQGPPRRHRAARAPAVDRASSRS